MRMRNALLLPLLACFSVITLAAEPDGQSALRTAAEQAKRTMPATQPAAGFKADGVTAIFYDALPWKGQPTRAFAWVGFPANLKPGEKVPAMVLVHGGGGTAFENWVKIWTARGYAAIAMDTCGQLPRGTNNKWERDEHGGPPGWGGWEQTDLPPTDQWTYHAVTDVILAHSLLRSMPQVDADRVGLTGISWGGYLTCIVAGLDDRFKLAVPVYGCGFLGEDSTWLPNFEKLGAEKAATWLKAWDPSEYLPGARMPMLWVDGTNDFAYPLDSLQKSYRLPKGERTLCTRVRMKHGHGPGQTPEEIHAFADAILKGGTPLPRITEQGPHGRLAIAVFDSPTKIVSAELNFTRDTGKWKERKWETTPAEIDTTHNRATGSIPPDATVYYMNLTDERGLVVSTEHTEVKPAE
jgi:dienelactone hydrolase